jgi:hypothetical protein
VCRPFSAAILLMTRYPGAIRKPGGFTSTELQPGKVDRRGPSGTGFDGRERPMFTIVVSSIAT